MAEGGDRRGAAGGPGETTFRVAGMVRGGRDRLALDIAAVQPAFERLGRLNRIDIRVRPGST